MLYFLKWKKICTNIFENLVKTRWKKRNCHKLRFTCNKNAPPRQVSCNEYFLKIHLFSSENGGRLYMCLYEVLTLVVSCLVVKSRLSYNFYSDTNTDGRDIIGILLLLPIFLHSPGFPSPFRRHIHEKNPNIRAFFRSISLTNRIHCCWFEFQLFFLLK